MPARTPLADVPPDQFIQARNEMVRKLRERGEAEEARRVGALRRPSPALFIANQLAKRDRDSLDALIDASRRAQRAQVQGHPGDDLRDAMRAQREALHRLLEQAEQAAKEIGTSLTPELRRRIQDTVQTAATAEPEALRDGALESELSAAGFGALLTGPKAGAAARAASAAAHTTAAATQATANAKRAVAAVTEKASAAAARADTHQRAFKAKAEERKRQVAENRDRLLRQRELAHAEQAARRTEARARQLEQRAQQSQLAADRAQKEAEKARREATEAEAKAAQLRREPRR
jgi:hypothetical protein